MDAFDEELMAKQATARRRIITDIRKAVRDIGRATATRDELIRKAVETRVPRQDIMAATGLSRSRIYQIAGPR